MKRVPEMREGDGAEPFADGQPAALDAHLALLADKQDVADIFRRLFAMCLPDKGRYRGARRFQSGYNRLVAIAYHVAPEMFNGMTQEEVAGMLGISRRAFLKQLDEVRVMLAARRR